MCGLEYALKFPAVLRKAIQNGTIKLPEKLKTEFDEIHAFRGITIKTDAHQYPLDRSDFCSQMEKLQTNPDLPVNPNEWENYSCSCFKDLEELKLCFHLPRKRKGIAEGAITKEQGACIEDDSAHVHWFLYEGADPSPLFTIIEVY